MFVGRTATNRHYCCWKEYSLPLSPIRALLLRHLSERQQTCGGIGAVNVHSEAEINVILTQQQLEETLHSICNRARPSELETNRAKRWDPALQTYFWLVSEKCGLISAVPVDASLICISCVQIPGILLWWVPSARVALLCGSLNTP